MAIHNVKYYLQLITHWGIEPWLKPKFFLFVKKLEYNTTRQYRQNPILFYYRRMRMEILLWRVRTDKNISIKELSKMTGISVGALWNYENEVREPRLSQLEIIAKVLDVRISDLFDSEYK
jgi:DNA-binding Xre family transcriptional regulator